MPLYINMDAHSEKKWEQPIFSIKAHVFEIDPNTKKKWLPASTQAINVSYYYDNSRNSYRIISVEGSKAVINSTISHNMSFTRTSNKFGQWSDPKANTVYGLGFASESDMTKFVNKFDEVKDLMKNSSTGNLSTSEITIEPAVSISSLINQNDVTHSPERSNSTAGLTTNGVESQLKYENDRLKIALAQSSANAKKWEVELQTLKNNNARLTAALQESTSNVEQWKKQLAAYKEESSRLKKKVQDLERPGGSVQQQQYNDLQSRSNDLEISSQRKDQEIVELTHKLDEMKIVSQESQRMEEKMQQLEKEKQDLRDTVNNLRDQLGTQQASHTNDKQKILSLQHEATQKVQELLHIQTQLQSTLGQHT